MMLVVLILCVIGFFISLYTYLVEKKIKNEPDYKPVCDINDRISCTKPMKSEYANLFYFSNAFVGMAFYVLVGVLALVNAHLLVIIAASMGCLISCVLAYLLYFKIKSLCILCTCLYIINILLLVFSIFVG